MLLHDIILSSGVPAPPSHTCTSNNVTSTNSVVQAPLFLPPPVPSHYSTPWSLQQQRWQSARNADGAINLPHPCPNKNIPAPTFNNISTLRPPYSTTNYSYSHVNDPSLIFFGYLRQLPYYY